MEVECPECASTNTLPNGVEIEFDEGVVTARYYTCGDCGNEFPVSVL